MNLLEATRDRNLFSPWFERGDWSAWRAFLAALFGLPMDDTARALYERHTGRTDAPADAFSETWLIVGRRGGKSFVAALVAVYLAAFRDYTPHLQPGERGTVLILAADRRQARTILRYVAALITRVPMLSRLVERETAEGIDLTNRVSIEVHTASFRSVRGYTIVAALLDEVAFWRSEDTANPDREIVNAIRPGMATIPGAVLLGLSSPYSRRGVLWEAYRRHHSVNGSPVLVWQAPTRTMNPEVPQRIIDEAYEADPAAAAAEYGAEFRSHIETFLVREVVEDARRPRPLELPYRDGTRYQAFVDPAGGGSDEFTLAIGHRDQERIVVDVLRARKGTPAEIVSEYAAVLKAYGVRRVTCDRYAGSWPTDEFRRHGVHCNTAARAKSELYLDALSVFNSGRIEIPPDDHLVQQLTSLERRTSRGGRDSIDHPPGGHDDRANAIAGLSMSASRGRCPPLIARADT